MEAQEWIELSKHITWPIVVIFICCVFFRKVQRLFEAIIIRIETGAPLETPWMSLGAPSQLSSPEKKEAVSDQHLALVHSSWRYPKKDRDFNKRMYCFAAIIQANPDVLERVESVTYFLPGWPEPYDRQKKTDGTSNFRIKDLAWGEFTLTAEVKIKDQSKPIKLKRYINLSEKGPRL